MKRPTKQLLKDLLDDSVSAEFRGVLMDKTLRSARQRKRVRYFSVTSGVMALLGCFAFIFQEVRKASDSYSHTRPLTSNAASASHSVLRIVNTTRDSVVKVASPSSASAVAIIHTTEVARPKEVDDQQLLSLLSDKSVALVNRGTHNAELIFFGSKDEIQIPVQ